nr:hypothetical transcript [Hymenolepis microstoma]
MVDTGVGDLVECAQSIENVELGADSSSSPTGYRLTIPLPYPTVNSNVVTTIVITGIPLNHSLTPFINPSQLPTIPSSPANLAFLLSQVPHNFSHFAPVMTPFLPPNYTSTSQYPPYFNGAFYMPNEFPYS